MSFTLGGKLIATLHVEIPLTGIASAEIELDSGSVLTGRQTLVTGDLSQVGTIIDGGTTTGRGRYHWIAGAAGWREEIPERGYGASIVRRSSVLRDAAEACGETIAIGVPDINLGLPTNNGYVRPRGPAWDVIRALGVPWYVDTAGVTQIAARPALAAYTDGALEEAYPEDGRLVIVPNAERIAGYLPGRTFGGAVIATTWIDASPGEPIRVTLWTRPTGETSHDLRASLDGIHAQNAAPARFYGRYRYRCVSRNGTLYGIEPIDTTLGLPKIDNRSLWFGIPGFDARLMDTPTGSEEITVVLPIVIVTFLDGLPSQPVIDGFQRKGDAGDIPLESSLDADQVKLGGALKYVARQDDTGTGATLTWTQVTPNSISLTIQNPGGGGDLQTVTIASASALTVTPTPLPAHTLKTVLDAPNQFKVKA